MALSTPIALVLCAALAQRAGETFDEHVAALCARGIERGSAPGLSVAVACGPELVFARGFGLADVEAQVPSTPRTIYRIGSVTKTFTAAAALVLAGRGELDLDAPLASVLPDVAPEQQAIRVRQLLSHTAGLADYARSADFVPARALSRRDVRAEIDRAARDFEPGRGFAYGNSGYFLLGEILERASSKPYGDLVGELFLTPLALTSTGMPARLGERADLARGYVARRGRFERAGPDNEAYTFAAAGLCSSALDLIAWQAALQSGRALSPEVYAQMAAPAALADGTRVAYGLGLALGSLADHPRVGHGGSVTGFRCELAWYPADDVAIAVLANASAAPVEQLETAIARRLFGLPDEPARARPIGRREIERCSGRYERPGITLSIRGEGQRLYAQLGREPAVALARIGALHFRTADASGTEIVFRGEGLRASACELRAGARVVELVRVP